MVSCSCENKYIQPYLYNPFNIKQHISADYLSPFWTFNIKQHYLHIISILEQWSKVHDFLLRKRRNVTGFPWICLPPRSAAAPGARCRTCRTWTWTWHYLGAVDVPGPPLRVSGLVEIQRKIHGFPKMICISGGVFWVFYSHVNVYRNGTMFNLL